MLRLLLSGLFAASLFLVPALVSVASAQTPTTSDAEARSLFEAGRIAYEAGRYQDSLQHFQRAYELSGRGALLYNIGSCLDRLRRDEEALAAFEQYLALGDAAPRRAEVEQRVAILRGNVAANAIAPQNVADAANTDTSSEDPLSPRDTARSGGVVRKWWFWTIIGVVVVGTAVGVGVAVGGGGTQGPQTVNSGTVVLRL
jgi:tetratricopeptide (TPR) repeat protein